MPSEKVVKIALSGAILAVAVDYFIRPTMSAKLGL
jgi:hypothetical protein